MFENPKGQWKGLDEYRKLIHRAENMAVKSAKPKLNLAVKLEVNQAIARELAKRGIQTDASDARKVAWDAIGRGKGKATWKGKDGTDKPKVSEPTQQQLKAIAMDARERADFTFPDDFGTPSPVSPSPSPITPSSGTQAAEQMVAQAVSLVLKTDKPSFEIIESPTEPFDIERQNEIKRVRHVMKEAQQSRNEAQDFFPSLAISSAALNLAQSEGREAQNEIRQVRQDAATMNALIEKAVRETATEILLLKRLQLHENEALSLFDHDAARMRNYAQEAQKIIKDLNEASKITGQVLALGQESTDFLETMAAPKPKRTAKPKARKPKAMSKRRKP